MLLNTKKRNFIGQMDTRIVVEQNTTTVDSVSNEPLDSWSELTEVWAQRMTKGGRLGFEANQQVANNVESYLIRYSSTANSIDASMRLYEKGTTDYYYITVVEKEKREGWILINCELKDN